MCYIQKYVNLTKYVKQSSSSASLLSLFPHPPTFPRGRSEGKREKTGKDGENRYLECSNIGTEPDAKRSAPNTCI